MILIRRKSEGLSLNVVVVAAIALVVLIVLLIIFSGRLNFFNKGVNECPPNTRERMKSEIKPLAQICPDGAIPKMTVQRQGTNEIIYCCPDIDICGKCALDEICDDEKGCVKSTVVDSPSDTSPGSPDQSITTA